MIRNLILSGGYLHDFATTSPILNEVLGEAGIESEIEEDFGVLAGERMLEFDMLSLNCCRTKWDGHAAYRPEWSYEIPAAERAGLLRFLAAGKGLLALHTCTLCFGDWPEYREVVGAWWEYGETTHPPIQEHAIRVHTDKHPIVDGVADFTITDELYHRFRFAGPVDPLAEADWEGETWPLLWAKSHGPARVCYNALGHNEVAFAEPGFQKLLRRGARWVAGGPD